MSSLLNKLTVLFGETAMATIMRLGLYVFLKLLTVAIIVDPVAAPSSTITIVLSLGVMSFPSDKVFLP